jgi:CheY-like chemotaxis protein
MIRVLLVEDDDDWRDLIADSLPGQTIDGAGTYREALDLLGRGTPYDVAIVDLNLVKSRGDRLVLDNLGNALLGHLQREHPSVLRIAVTGAPPGAVRGLIDRYSLTELLLKQSMLLSDVREAVDRALSAAGNEPSLRLRAARGAQWDEYSEWHDSMLHRIDQKARILQQESRNVSEMSRPVQEALHTVEALKATRTAFESDSSPIATMLAAIRNRADLDAAIAEFATVRDKYEGVF